jgi:hypothetical protein
MRSFDWLIYVGALGLMLAVIFALAPDADAPAPAPQSEFAEQFAQEMGPLLPGPSPLDEMVLVQVGEPQNGVGTAFAVNEKGDWLTARHVVEGCTKVTLEVAPGNYVPVANGAIDTIASSPGGVSIARTQRHSQSTKLLYSEGTLARCMPGLLQGIDGDSAVNARLPCA